MSEIADIDLSQIILSNIFKNKHFADKVINYLDINFFENDTEHAIADTLITHYTKYNQVPTVQELVSTMRENTDVHNLSKLVINDVLGTGIEVSNTDWLINQTERFIKRKRTLKAFESTFADFENNVDVSQFYTKFQQAAAFSFNSDVGHSLVHDARIRYDLYTKKVSKFPFGIKILDEVTYGGMDSDGTLNVILAPTNSGKSLFLGDVAANGAMRGAKVLVITLEMAEIKISERVESNLMDVPISHIRKMTKAEYHLKQKKYLDKMKIAGGDLIIKQYPTKCGCANDFKNFIIECKNKLDYDFNLVIIDYLNICKTNENVKNQNSYAEIKSIAEQLRALAIEFNFPILTATQSNREAQGKSSIGLENVSESHGLSATADFIISLVVTETMAENNQCQIEQLKSRYNDKNNKPRFMLGMDRKYMRLFDIETEVVDISNKDQEITDQSFDLSALTG